VNALHPCQRWRISQIKTIANKAQTIGKGMGPAILKLCLVMKLHCTGNVFPIVLLGELEPPLLV